MTPSRAFLAARGAVVLSENIVCDGFDPDCSIRVQTHVHDDHLIDFASSKGTGSIVCAVATRDLLISWMNADLPYRRNFRALVVGEPELLDDGSKLVLEDAGHMAGSVQVAVTHPDGYSVGYSGDFAWPLERVISVDELVLDATYGSPTSVRRYSQQEAEERFVEEALARLKTGPVLIHAHRGTLQRAIALLDDVTQVPMVGSKLQCKESLVYQRNGYNQGALIAADTPDGKAALASERYILFTGRGDPKRDLRPNEHTIVLSAYMMPAGDPFLEFSERSCRVAISNHADFHGTLAYVDAVRPSLVLTDGSRSPHAEMLAIEISSRLGVEARSVAPRTTQAWT